MFLVILAFITFFIILKIGKRAVDEEDQKGGPFIFAVAIIALLVAIGGNVAVKLGTKEFYSYKQAIPGLIATPLTQVNDQGDYLIHDVDNGVDYYTYAISNLAGDTKIVYKKQKLRKDVSVKLFDDEEVHVPRIERKVGKIPTNWWTKLVGVAQEEAATYQIDFFVSPSEIIERRDYDNGRKVKQVPPGTVEKQTESSATK